jgi:uncharacterized protein YecT (DUF1311 family)
MTALLVALMMQMTAPPNQLQKCLTQAKGDTVKVLVCYDAEIRRSDKVMHGVAGKLSKKLDRAGRQLLKKSQAAFLTHRQLSCRLKHHRTRHAKAASQHTKWCEITMTRSRTGVLTRLLKAN